VGDLNFATRQMIEVAKVINVTKSKGGQKCLILLDEPTSVLSEDETKNLFAQMRKIAAKGHGVVFISHRLDEVLEVTDRIYVYKDGESAGSLDTKDAHEAKLYEMMVGRSTSTEYYKLDRQEKPREEVLLEVRGLGLSGVFKHVSFKLHRGEILGICGVIGSGKEDICEVVCGDERPTSGEIILKGGRVSFTSPAQGLKKGILMIPKERLVEGVVRTASVENNISLSNLASMAVACFVPHSRVRRQAVDWIKRMRIKTSGPRELLIQLSGGNQQKVIFSRALASECDILILNHPTRGVDVGAKEEIYATIRDIIAAGKAVILLGDTLDECIGMSSRVLVMKDGLVTGDFDASAGEKPSQVDVVSMMM
jgi:ribose transport system ATP-binding protein